jgi:DNA-binding SARP family transcriptional activator
MIELRTLGAVDLRTADGGEAGAVLRQPKRLALLAYLAADQPRRFHRRDTLLAFFWPELDESHARAALRRSLHFLRQGLGPAALASRGDEEVAVPETTVRCDATEMERALETGEPERALSLYLGPFLDGLHIEGGSTEFQEWVDRRREALRRSAAAAAGLLIHRAEREGRSADASAWARRALDLLPDDETALRRLLTLLDRSGERPGAIQAYEDFARRMAQELDLDPSPETSALAASIRARAGDGAASFTVAVLPFTIRGDARFGYLAEGMVDLLATKLDGAGAIRTVDPRALLHFLARSGPAHAGAAGPDSGRAIAAHFDAGHYLLGSVVEAAGRLQATATLYRRNGAQEASAHALVESEAELFELVDELVRQLLASRAVASSTRLGRIAALTTGSLDALRAYLQGERELRAGRYFEALERFQAAAEADSSFALAYYRAAAAASGCALPDLARQLAGHAYEHRARLSPHDQLVLSAQRAWLDGAVGEAESLYTTITGTYPDDVEVWFHLGDLLFHSNPMRGHSSSEARQPFERVLSLEPDHLQAMIHLARIEAVEGRRDEMLELIGRALRAGPDADQALAMRALRASAVSDAAGIAAVAGELRAARAVTVASAFADIALYAGDLEGAESLARRFLEVARAPELRALCHVQLAHLAVAQGDRDKAREELQSTETLDRAWGLETRAQLALLPFAPAPAPELESVRQDLFGWDAAGTPPSSFPIFAMHNGLHAAIREYLLGMTAAALGDRQAAGAHAAALMQGAARDGGLVDCLATELAATSARAEGRPAEALSLLERTRPRLWYQLTVASPFFCLVSRRFLQAELLVERGRAKEARGWYTSLVQRSPYELVYRTVARERLSSAEAAASDR